MQVQLLRNKPINIQEELKKAAMALRDEVGVFISRHKGNNLSGSPQPNFMSFNEDARPMSVEPQVKYNPSSGYPGFYNT